MTSITIAKARNNLYQILADVNNNSEPIILTNSKGKNGVLISEDDWKAIQETLYLNAIPGMTESILRAASEKDGQVYDPDEAW